MSIIVLDGLSEEEFRRSIEMRLRHDLAGSALERLRGLIAPYAQPGGILPERFLTVSATDLNLYGWDGIADALRRHDRPGRPVTAIAISYGWPGEEPPVPDTEGRLNPLVETAYFTDDAFPFSASGREDLLDGYSFHGCTWADDCEATENTVSLGGIDDLHGALALLEARLLASEDPDPDEIRAGSLGACILSVLLFQAVGDRIKRDGLPRPLCVMAGSNGVYPYFDAPVVGIPEDVRKAAEAAEEDEVVDTGVPGPRYSSLLVTGIPRARKRAVLVLEESEEEMAVRIAALRGLHHRDEASAPVEPAALPEVAPEPVGESAILPVPGGPLLTKKTPGQAWDFRDMLGPPRDGEPPAALFEPEPGPEYEPPYEAPAAFEPEAAPEPEPEPAPSLEPAAEAVPQPEPEPEPEPEVAVAPEPAFDPLPPPAASPLAAPPLFEKPPVPDLPFETPRAVPVAPLAAPREDIAPEPPLVEIPRPRETEPVVAAARPRFPSQSPVGPGFAMLDQQLQDRLESLLAPHLPELRPIERAPEPAAEPEVPVVPDYGPVWPLGIGWLEASEQAQLNEAPAPRPSLLSRLTAWIRRR